MMSIKTTVVAVVAVDTDLDGIPDFWEKKYKLNEVDPSDSVEDFDKDGILNLFEFLDESNPRDSKSYTRDSIQNTELKKYDGLENLKLDLVKKYKIRKSKIKKNTYNNKLSFLAEIKQVVLNLVSKS